MNDTTTPTPPPDGLVRPAMPNWDKTTVETRDAFAVWTAGPAHDRDNEHAFYDACKAANIPACASGKFLDLTCAHINAFAEMDAAHEEALAMNSGPFLCRTTIETRALFRAAVAVQDAGEDSRAAWRAFDAATARLDPCKAPGAHVWMHNDALREIGEAWPPIDPLTGLPPDGPKGPDGRYLDWPDMPAITCPAPPPGVDGAGMTREEVVATYGEPCDDRR